MRGLVTFCLTTVVVLFSCSPRHLPERDYFGTLHIEDRTVRLVLSYNGTVTSLVIVGFRGYEVPIHDVSFRKDTLRFNRTDVFSSYKGRYNASTGTITGQWQGEDSIVRPLTFVPALSDTIVGLNPRTVNSYHYSEPPKENDGISVCSLRSARLNPVVIDSLMKAIMKRKFGYVHSILVARNNCLAVEEYFYGFKRETYFGIQSATKSMVSALTGIALDKGEISNVNTPLCQHLHDYQDLLCNDQNKSITLHDVLSMSTGLKWDEVSHMYGDDRNSAVIASKEPDELRYLLTQPRSTEKVFAYNSLNHAIMSRVLMQATNLDNTSEFKQRLLEPLGITQYDLGEPDEGIIGDISLRPRDMLKFGLMCCSGGVWNGKQVVPPGWIEQSTSPKLMLDGDFGYGYFWWTKRFLWKDKTVDSYFAWGFGGQYIFVVPEIDLVVVFNGTNWSMDLKQFYFEIMQEYIVRACDM